MNEEQLIKEYPNITRAHYLGKQLIDMDVLDLTKMMTDLQIDFDLTVETTKNDLLKIIHLPYDYKNITDEQIENIIKRVGYNGKR